MKLLFGMTLSALVITMINGCATLPRRAIYLEQNIEQYGIKTLAILPVVDRRSDKGKTVEFESGILKPVQAQLEKKGYGIIMLSTFGNDSSLNTEVVADMEDTELISFLPKGADAIVVVYLEDYRSEAGFKFIMPTLTTSIELSGKVINREVGVLWSDKIKSPEGRPATGVLGVMLASAIPCCGRYPGELFETFPERKNKQ